MLLLGACGGGGDSGGNSNPAPATPTTPPATAPVVTLNFGLKQLRFSWAAVYGATHYTLLEDPDGVSGYEPVNDHITSTAADHNIDLLRRINARYIVQACNAYGCTDSVPIQAGSGIVAAIGYFKASNTDARDWFGHAIALSGDGSTLAVAAFNEDGNSSGINGDQTDNSASAAGAVYVFTRTNGTWSQSAYLKASNNHAAYNFGSALALSFSGTTLAVGARHESSDAWGIDGDVTAPMGYPLSGAVYVFVRTLDSWTQQAFVKASNASIDDYFGTTVALNAAGDMLAVGAPTQGSAGIGPGAVYVYKRWLGAWSEKAILKASNGESGDGFGSALALSDTGIIVAGAAGEESNATGINGDGGNNSAAHSGAVYVFFPGANDTWSQQAYLKASDSQTGTGFGYSCALNTGGTTLAVGASGATYVFTRTGSTWAEQARITASNTESGDDFGRVVALASDGNTLAVGAPREGSNAAGINGDEADNSVPYSGAVYIFTRSGTSWLQKAYVKASNPNGGDNFGSAIAFANSGNTLAVGARYEAGAATGINGDQTSNSATQAGAVYLY